MEIFKGYWKIFLYFNIIICVLYLISHWNKHWNTFRSNCSTVLTIIGVVWIILIIYLMISSYRGYPTNLIDYL